MNEIGQNLIIDADDTLWEHTLFYDLAKDEFVRLLNHSSMSHEQVRAALDDIEKENSRLHGYGVDIFAHSLRACFEYLRGFEVDASDLDKVVVLADLVRDHPMQVIDGVPETLDYLSQRHRLTLFTKGSPAEQHLKIEASGLQEFFDETVVVHEKTVAAYRQLVREHGLDARASWMVGNSPMSDINPALEAGLNAVYVPHANTWSIEHQELRHGPGRLLRLQRFVDLRGLF